MQTANKQESKLPKLTKRFVPDAVLEAKLLKIPTVGKAQLVSLLGTQLIKRTMTRSAILLRRKLAHKTVNLNNRVVRHKVARHRHARAVRRLTATGSLIILHRATTTPLKRKSQRTAIRSAFRQYRRTHSRSSNNLLKYSRKTLRASRFIKYYRRFRAYSYRRYVVGAIKSAVLSRGHSSFHGGQLCGLYARKQQAREVADLCISSSEMLRRPPVLVKKAGLVYWRYLQHIGGVSLRAKHRVLAVGKKLRTSGQKSLNALLRSRTKTDKLNWNSRKNNEKKQKGNRKRDSKVVVQKRKLPVKIRKRWNRLHFMAYRRNSRRRTILLTRLQRKNQMAQTLWWSCLTQLRHGAISRRARHLARRSRHNRRGVTKFSLRLRRRRPLSTLRSAVWWEDWRLYRLRRVRRTLRTRPRSFTRRVFISLHGVRAALKSGTKMKWVLLQKPAKRTLLLAGKKTVVPTTLAELHSRRVEGRNRQQLLSLYSRKFKNRWDVRMRAWIHAYAHSARRENIAITKLVTHVSGSVSSLSAGRQITRLLPVIRAGIRHRIRIYRRHQHHARRSYLRPKRMRARRVVSYRRRGRFARWKHYRLVSWMRYRRKKLLRRQVWGSSLRPLGQRLRVTKQRKNRCRGVLLSALAQLRLSRQRSAVKHTRRVVPKASKRRVLKWCTPRGTLERARHAGTKKRRRRLSGGKRRPLKKQRRQLLRRQKVRRRFGKHLQRPNRRRWIPIKNQLLKKKLYTRQRRGGRKNLRWQRRKLKRARRWRRRWTKPRGWMVRKPWYRAARFFRSPGSRVFGLPLYARYPRVFRNGQNSSTIYRKGRSFRYKRLSLRFKNKMCRLRLIQRGRLRKVGTHRLAARLKLRWRSLRQLLTLRKRGTRKLYVRIKRKRHKLKTRSARPLVAQFLSNRRGVRRLITTLTGSKHLLLKQMTQTRRSRKDVLAAAVWRRRLPWRQLRTRARSLRNYVRTEARTRRKLSKIRSFPQYLLRARRYLWRRPQWVTRGSTNKRSFRLVVQRIGKLARWVTRRLHAKRRPVFGQTYHFSRNFRSDSGYHRTRRCSLTYSATRKQRLWLRTPKRRWRRFFGRFRRYRRQRPIPSSLALTPTRGRRLAAPRLLTLQRVAIAQTRVLRSIRRVPRFSSPARTALTTLSSELQHTFYVPYKITKYPRPRTLRILRDFASRYITVSRVRTRRRALILKAKFYQRRRHPLTLLPSTFSKFWWGVDQRHQRRAKRHHTINTISTYFKTLCLAKNLRIQKLFANKLRTSGGLSHRWLRVRINRQFNFDILLRATLWLRRRYRINFAASRLRTTKYRSGVVVRQSYNYRLQKRLTALAQRKLHESRAGASSVILMPGEQARRYNLFLINLNHAYESKLLAHRVLNNISWHASQLNKSSSGFDRSCFFADAWRLENQSTKACRMYRCIVAAILHSSENTLLGTIPVNKRALTEQAKLVQYTEQRVTRCISKLRSTVTVVHNSKFALTPRRKVRLSDYLYKIINLWLKYSEQCDKLASLATSSSSFEWHSTGSDFRRLRNANSRPAYLPYLDKYEK